MEIRGRSLRNRVFNAVFATVLMFIGASLAEGSLNWTLLLIGVPLLLVLELLGDVLGRRIREWRAS
ncbi:hypothetical protein [Halococcus hamelinensis]|uniref:hypothetical protein n=1 Tax=Halococcus hamelinensis TaxID=332168 RepID=UPI000AF885CA|nr:hypothetical protein [Halococcus hamelinensis]